MIIMNSKTACFSLVICLLFLIHDTLSLKCAPTACETVDCRNAIECGPGEIKARGGWCLCCDVCKKIVGENANCAADTPIAGQLSDKVACGEGLICYRGTCQKEEVVFSGH